MPYHLVKVVGEKDAYYVKDSKGKYYSTKPLTLEQAKKQMVALNIALSKEG